ncbi:MAG TPA: GGDEF domain-containing protein [candidate division Zixibacteria bacterium]|nr:GGDEF domain-containing protein [candidate division Zixibacteria bacterium]
MSVQSILIIILAGLVLLLAALLFARIRRERRLSATFRGMPQEDFSEFLLTNSIRGSIVEVARKVSSLLIEAFGCERIVFLRKKRGTLELNYYHGITGFQRNDFRMRYSETLATRLRADFFPHRTDELAELLPKRLQENLARFGMDIYIPIFWRENLYGVYFIRSTAKTKSPAFVYMLASLAQSLSAAYHIKWHESKYESLRTSIEREKKPPLPANEREESVGKILRLVRNRRTETVVPGIVDALKEIMGVDRLVYSYASRIDNGSTILVQRGVTSPIPGPSVDVLNSIVARLDGREFAEVEALRDLSEEAQEWLEYVRDRGLKSTASFPLRPDRSGLLAWAGGGDAGQVVQQLRSFQSSAVELVENAESFEVIEELSYTDGLTGLANQRYFFKRLDEEVSRASRYQRNLALIMFDMDDLKCTNDTYGHLAGDALLSRMGEILKTSIRTIDIVARYGGDEFCAIMPEADEDTCIRFMERLKNRISREEFIVDGIDKPLHCTVSIGGAIFPHHAEDPKKLIFAADMALLKAKETGRNKSLIYSTAL